MDEESQMLSVGIGTGRTLINRRRISVAESSNLDGPGGHRQGNMNWRKWLTE